jgi:glycosyltransferase involved in cell wall biosynthesis
VRLLFFGTYDARRHPRVEVLAEGFRATGDTVVECNVPLGLDTADRVRMLKQPWRLPLLAVRLLWAWLRLVAKSRRVGAFDAVVVGYLGPMDVRLARRLWPRRPIALDQLTSVSDTAADRAVGRGGLLSRALVAVDRGAADAADVVVVDTEEQRPTVLGTPRSGVVVVPVGAPDWWFSPPRALPASPLRVAFFGLYTPLQGTRVIAQAIADLADEPRVTFTMVGRGQDYDAARAAAAANPRVDWVEWVDPGALPALVAGHHVCLGVFGTGPKALRVVPNKVYQGAAAGCVLVTSDTPPQRSMLGDAALYVPPGDAPALAHVLRSLVADPARVGALRDAAYDLAERRFRPGCVIAPLRDLLMRGTT